MNKQELDRQSSECLGFVPQSILGDKAVIYLQLTKDQASSLADCLNRLGHDAKHSLDLFGQAYSVTIITED